jgi:hypothetical protein
MVPDGSLNQSDEELGNSDSEEKDDFEDYNFSFVDQILEASKLEDIEKQKQKQKYEDLEAKYTKLQENYTALEAAYKKSQMD